MEFDSEKYIRNLKIQIWILRIIILLMIIAVAGAIVLGYFYTKPYVEKFNEFAVQFQNAKPYLNQISQSPLISEEIKLAINNFGDFEETINKVKSFLNLLPK